MASSQNEIKSKTSNEGFLFDVVDLSSFLKDPKSSAEDCKKIASMLHRTGIVIVRDPRVDASENDKFIDNMEKYYELEEKEKMKDVHPEYFYQIGATPEGIEKARNHCARAKTMGDEDAPVTECPPGKDPKWRYFWRIGPRPEQTEFKQLNVSNVIPKKIEGFETRMETWGNLIMSTVRTVSEMAAEGFGLERNSFTSLMENGPHLLAPTGSDLKKHGQKNKAFAAYHYDLNFLTIHGRSRFPGLFVWTRENKRLPVKMPKGCLLLQAGKQFEWLTGGHVLAGFHEVVVSDRTLAAIEKAEKEGRSTWRVSSTLFAHIASDNTLEPLGKFSKAEDASKYPATKAGKQVSEELKAIKLGQ
mmetsp:Transcript_414/g.686  ORF Transcript_414/g.686 Transcript_414/m.686 type:complete len:359 (-) Transcript_414:282-1358(-)|eukprot:CAMPEP_0197517400 /NCGR_PEP_ID=MMETSP1318-20131121/2400_1 /TAXON_ID=552666 /ORGANISM="Partenskyella glossopodia, Strain RCC365" /LENGTH=358 /DNA_ID=CAMNT_0043066913 /DNA_START=85 /DNA_END=1161 /DNA_ORIENTATION=+